MKPDRRLLPVALFTGAYVLVALAAALFSGNAEFLFYLAVMAVLIAVVWAVDRSVRLTRGALWGLSIWGLAHMVGGLVPAPAGWPAAVPDGVIYNVWLIPDRLKYDHIVHAWGFGITTWVCWQGLAAAMRARGADPRPTAGVLVLVAAAGMGFGALNELIEFVATLLVPETNVGGYRNTGWDLVSNLVGVTVAVTIIGLGGRAGRASRPADRGRPPSPPPAGSAPVPARPKDPAPTAAAARES